MSPDPDIDPKTERELVAADRDRAREELGQAVEELTHKLDVPARASEKVTEAKENTRAAAAGAKDKVADSAQHAGERVAETAAVAKERAAESATAAKERAADTAAVAKEKAAEAATVAKEKAPEPVARGGRQAADFVRANPVPVAIGVVSGVVLWQVLRKRGRR
ncbi:DUF3618 domain-containing protein [Nocardia harenae]|uniref:DUF3618 domain-containing protein n=1 Tax=Nocardia harenae TaxID=358707 RepID=UPI00082A9FA0|nr:DUF3618 domain-containing protein [Nocardia harenae]